MVERNIKRAWVGSSGAFFASTPSIMKSPGKPGFSEQKITSSKVCTRSQICGNSASLKSG